MGGHGGLNILPKKTWNVYNRENRLRVKRDEAKAQKQKEDEEKRQAQADRDFRREKLVEKKRKRDLDKASTSTSNNSNGPATTTEAPRQSLQHENFFKEQEMAFKKGQQARQKAHKEDPGEQDERFRFARTCKDNSKPWYAQSGTSFDPKGRDPSAHLSLPTRIRMEREEVQKNRKWEERKEDPKAVTLEALGIHLLQDSSAGAGGGVGGERPNSRSGRERRKGKRTKHKSKRSKRSPPPPKTIEDLRKERLEREEHERRKTLELMAAHQNSSNHFPQTKAKAFHSSFGYARSRPTDTDKKWM